MNLYFKVWQFHIIVYTCNVQVEMAEHLLVQEYDCWNQVRINCSLSDNEASCLLQGTEFCNMVLLMQGHCKPAVTKVNLFHSQVYLRSVTDS